MLRNTEPIDIISKARWDELGQVLDPGNFECASCYCSTKKSVSMTIYLSSFIRCCSYSNQSRFKSVSVFGVRAEVGSAITRGRVLCFACVGGMKRRIEGKQLERFEKVVKRKIVWGNTRQLLVNFTVGSLRRSLRAWTPQPSWQDQLIEELSNIAVGINEHSWCFLESRSAIFS